MNLTGIRQTIANIRNSSAGEQQVSVEALLSALEATSNLTRVIEQITYSNKYEKHLLLDTKISLSLAEKLICKD